MGRRPKVWMYAGARAGNKPSPAEKDAITLACERVIGEVLIPRFLPEIRPHAEFNYPIGIPVRWRNPGFWFDHGMEAPFQPACWPIDGETRYGPR